MSTLRNDLLLRTLRREIVERPPVWMMRQAGRYLPDYRELREKYSFFQRVQTPELAAKITLQPVEQIGVDAAIIFSDILVVPQAMGLEVQLIEEKGPFLPNPIRRIQDLRRIHIPEVKEQLSYVFKAIELTKKELNGSVPLIGFAGAPWTLFCYMIEGQGSKTFDLAKSFCFSQPAMAHDILQMITDTTISYLKAQVNAGADLVQIFDSWAGALADNDFETFVIEPTARIVKQVKAAHPHVPIIGFPRGSSPQYEDYVAKTGVDALGCDTAAPLKVMARMQRHLPVQGNLDPLLLLAGGDAMERRVRAILDSLAAKPYVFNLGHGILPETPVENVERLIRLVRGES